MGKSTGKAPGVALKDLLAKIPVGENDPSVLNKIVESSPDRDALPYNMVWYTGHRGLSCMVALKSVPSVEVVPDKNNL